jgi:hypothetical protein
LLPIAPGTSGAKKGALTDCVLLAAIE